MGGHIWVKHECGTRNAGGRLCEYFQPLPHHLEIDECEACNVPARMRQARNETLIDGIVDRRHNDRNGACCLPERPDDRRRLANDYVGRERYQFCYVCPYATGIGSAKACLDLDVAAVCPSKFLKSLLQHYHSRLSFWIVGNSHQHADTPHALSLLRMCRERPRRSAAEQRDELAAVHSITSSARPDNGSGTVRPSALAVLRL